MKIIIAPDSYKESLSALEVASSIEQGFRLEFNKAKFIITPMADGGEGTLECLTQEEGAKILSHAVKGPLGETITAQFGILKNNTAVIEMAKASGLHLVPHTLRNPLKTNTYGTGELIRFALDKGCRHFIIGLGGSATCDGGVGALSALGIRFLKANGQPITPCGAELHLIDHIDMHHVDSRLKEATFILAHDVENPLVGLDGALLYAPQKGASSNELEILHKGFEHYAYILNCHCQKNIGMVPGTGAAGGLCAGLFAFLNATLKPGASVVIQATHLRKKIQTANLVITGEGQIDAQTVQGKTPIAVAKLAKEYNIPVIAFAARLSRGYQEVYDHGIDAVFSIANGPLPQNVCLAFTKPLLIAAANNVARLLRLGTL